MSRDIPNPTYYDENGYLNLRALNSTRGRVVHISAWKTTCVGGTYTINVFDDGNEHLTRDATWRLIGSDHNRGKLLLERTH